MKKNLLFSLLVATSLGSIKFAHAEQIEQGALAYALGTNVAITTAGVLLGSYIKDPVVGALATGAICTVAPIFANKVMYETQEIKKPLTPAAKNIVAAMGYCLNWIGLTAIAAVYQYNIDHRNYNPAFYGPLFGFGVAFAYQNAIRCLPIINA